MLEERYSDRLKKASRYIQLAKILTGVNIVLILMQILGLFK
jgi:hypothetical protein